VAQAFIQLLQTLVREAPPLDARAGSRHSPIVDGGNAAAVDGDGGDAGSYLPSVSLLVLSRVVCR
jgi:hypothetical protein